MRLAALDLTALPPLASLLSNAQVLQIIQLVKARHERRRQAALNVDEDGNEINEDAADDNAGQPSRVGQKLSDLTTSRVVLLVLAMLFVLPVFNIGSGIYGTAPPLGSAGVKVLSTKTLSSEPWPR